jgi:1-phosphatidylinositol-4-phosphate 5-kinase
MDKSNWEKVEDGDGPRASTRHPSFDIEKGPSIDDNVKRQPSSRSGLSDLLEPVKAAADRLIAAVPKRVEVENFVFKDFLPHLFADVRQLCKINPNEYADSFLQTTKEKFSEGRSGAFLYFSSDLRYIVKTTTADESFALRSIMPQYVEYIRSNPNSLMVRFLGCHSLTLYGRTLHFVVMLNVFHGAQFSERFDLKGSWVNRHGDSRDMGRKSDKNTSSPLYKDSDLHNKISLPKGKQKNLRNQIARDTEFLRDLGLMDYSLLIGVIRRRFEVVDNAVSRDTDELGRDHNGAFNAAMVEGPGSYHMGIIDILQEWNWDKKLERFFKIYFRFSDPDGLSAIPPDRYQARFMQRAVIEVFEGMDEGQDETNSESSTDRGSVSNRRYSVTPVGGYSQNHSPPPPTAAPPPSTSPKTSSFEVMSPLCEMD